MTQEQLKALFVYQNGRFICRKTGFAKKLAPITNAHRYHRISIKGKAYLFHRMVYLYCHGYFPKIIDHIDNDRANNCIENLREATQQQNCINRTRHRNNKSGHKNVYWQANCKKWNVSMFVCGIRKQFGMFNDLELAALIAEEARDKYQGKFARS